MMRCPVDDRELQIAERHGIEIDYCPSCRGVWLDRGELDKIIERSQVGDPDRDDRSRRSPRDDGSDDWDDDRPTRFGRKRNRWSYLASQRSGAPCGDVPRPPVLRPGRGGA